MILNLNSRLNKKATTQNTFCTMTFPTEAPHICFFLFVMLKCMFGFVNPFSESGTLLPSTLFYFQCKIMYQPVKVYFIKLFTVTMQSLINFIYSFLYYNILSDSFAMTNLHSAFRASCRAATTASGWGNFSLRGGPFFIPVHRDVSLQMRQ